MPIKPTEERSVLIEAPLGDVPPVVLQGQLHVEFRVESSIRMKLLELANALDKRQAKLKNGVRVTLPTHAAQWLIEQLAENS